ncbi:S53 family peptidase [Fulvimonas yonginensis]|uniref:S53 family peptidase n=1 Tax=Fulvimonas yonginensis TaxID=1495200 RepID=A0ABU8JDQ9_9GAMM
MQTKISMLCLALGAALGSMAMPVQAAAGGNAWVATATHAHALAATASAKDLAEPGMPIHIDVALKLQNRAVLDAFIADAHNPHSSTYGATLLPQDVAANFAPSDAQVQAVVDYLAKAGFTHITVAPNRLMVSADGTAAGAQTAFATRLIHAHDSEGHAAYANIDDAKVPAALAGTVLSVLGLQTVSHAHTMIRTAGKPGSGGGGAGTITGHNPTTFPTIYNAGGTPTASTVTVGIISDGDMTQPLNDLASFTSRNGLPAVNTQVVVAGPAGTDTSGTAEWDLDSQDIVGMSGGVGKLIFYTATSLSNSALTTAYNRAVSDNQARVINVSLGECETYAYQDGSMAADDQIFAVAVAQGQTFSVSTGDDGSNECGGSPRGTTPSYPASSPYVVAVSGTTLGTGSNNSWASETLWSKAGGSPSTVEPKPSWQTQGGGSTRDVADVAFDADPNSGAVIIVNGSNAQYGGTSLSAPLFAATWARMLAGHASLGFAGPHLYQVPSSVYHDVTSGSNGGESAGTGWDYASGFGSIIVGNLNASL